MQANQEKKFIVTTFSSAATKEGLFLELNDCAQGATDTTRIGDKISITKISLKLWRTIPGSATGRFSIRVLLIVDSQNLVTSSSDLFIDATGPAAPLLMYVKDKRRRFKVLFDSGSCHLDQYNKGKTSKWSRALNINTQFNGGTDAILTNSVKLVAISNIADAASTKPLLIGSARVDFVDN
jgi:hypothetical protein